MINFQLEKVIQCAQMSVDCFRASKLVTLGYACILTFKFWSNNNSYLMFYRTV